MDCRFDREIMQVRQLQAFYPTHLSRSLSDGVTLLVSVVKMGAL